jgi:hypothetical protein
VQGYPSEEWKLGVVRPWVYGPFMSSPKAVNTDNNWRGRRGRRDSFDISTKYYEFWSPVIGRGPEFMQRRGHIDTRYETVGTK